MTVKELKEKLNDYPEDSQVVFTLPGAKHYFWADKLWATDTENPVIEAEDCVEFEDVVGIAEECLEEYSNELVFEKYIALKDFLVTAKEIKDEG